MGYLQPTDYVNFGLDAATTDDWITAASALIDSYCRRQRSEPNPVCGTPATDRGRADRTPELSSVDRNRA